MTDDKVNELDGTIPTLDASELSHEFGESKNSMAFY